jgi:hypothetical protein
MDVIVTVKAALNFVEMSLIKITFCADIKLHSTPPHS